MKEFFFQIIIEAEGLNVAYHVIWRDAFQNVTLSSITFGHSKTVASHLKFNKETADVLQIAQRAMAQAKLEWIDICPPSLILSTPTGI